MSKQQSLIEIYTLEWCPYCRKTKAYFKSKGLTFREYNIEKDEIKNEMVERTGGKKTVPQIFIAGKKIGGYDDLINIKAEGELQEVLNLPEKEDKDSVRDVVIIGAGPAGLSAAVYCARKGFDVLILSLDLGGQVIETDTIENYMGMYQVKGAQLMQTFWEHVAEYDVTTRLGEKVENIICQDERYLLEMVDGSQIMSRAVIICSGTQKRQLGVSGENELKGKGIHYCAICDGFLYAGQAVMVVGGGNSGLEASLDLAKLGCDVSLIETNDHLQGDSVLQHKVNSQEQIKVYTATIVKEIKGKDKVQSVVIRDNNTGKLRELAVNAVFIEIGLIPNSGFACELVEINDLNEIIINDSNETSVKGIWAAGDVTDIKDKQIIVAAAEGVKAALRVSEYFNG